MNWLIDALQDHIATMFGLAAGSIAHFGRKISDGQDISLKHVLGYIMQLGLIGIVATVSTRWFGITDNDLRALLAAILAVSANEIIAWIKQEGWRDILERLLGAFGLSKK
jgi:hypothetical protein